MKIFKISTISTQAAIILSAFIIGASIFLTTWIFFGGDGNRQKLSVQSQTANKPIQANPMTPEQIKKIQEQRAVQMKRPVMTATSTN